jgi:fluoride exporter
VRTCLLVGLGSALGGAARWLIIAAALSGFGPAFPVGTLVANVLGSLLIGVLAGATRGRLAERVSPDLRAAIGAGFCGGFTTYSFFSWQALLYAGLGRPLVATIYIVLSVVLALAAVAAGYAVGSRAAAVSDER